MLQTAHTAVAAALSLIYWVQLMRALNTSFSTAACGASFYTNETDAKTPHTFVTGGLRTAWELTELLWLFARGRRIRKREMKGEKEFWAKRPSSWCHLRGCLPQQERASGQRPRACATEPGSASSFLLTHPRPQVWPLHLRERSSRGRRESWPSWQGNSSLAAGSGVGAERFSLPECYGKSHSQLNVQFQFLISLQNRRSWFFYFFLSNSSHPVRVSDSLWTRESQVHSKPQSTLQSHLSQVTFCTLLIPLIKNTHQKMSYQPVKQPYCPAFHHR